MSNKYPKFRSAKGTSCFIGRAKACKWCSFWKKGQQETSNSRKCKFHSFKKKGTIEHTDVVPLEVEHSNAISLQKE